MRAHATLRGAVAARLVVVALLIVAGGAGCDGGGTRDAGSLDAGARDSGLVDGGDVAGDGGRDDGGRDDGGRDGGNIDGDGGSIDGGGLDGGADPTVDGGVSPCGTHACHASASCVGDGAVYACECPAVSFAKPAFADPSVVRDCIEPDVCITRGDTQSIYNGAVETQAAAGPGGSAPAGTRWTLRGCAVATPDDFGTFLGAAFTNMNPTGVIDRPGCLLLPDHGTRYRIVFRSWSTGGPGGEISYERARIVGDGEACP